MVLNPDQQHALADILPELNPNWTYNDHETAPSSNSPNVG